VKDRGKKAAAILGQVWGIGKRRFGRDWGRRLWLFDRLVWTVMGYGVEIWGWKERGGLEKLEERYLRWVLGVEGSTPWYLVREELQRDKLSIRAGRRAWEYERRLRMGKGSEIARKCWEELRRRSGRGKMKSGWEGERWEYFEKKGIGWGEVEKKLEEVEEGVVWCGKWEVEDRNRQREREREERCEAIKISRYNR